MRAFTVPLGEMEGEGATLAEKGSELHGLLDRLILLLVLDLAGEQLHLLQQRSLLVLGGEVLAVVGEVVAADDDLL